MAGRKRTAGRRSGMRLVAVPVATSRQEEQTVTTPDPGAQPDQKPKARKAKTMPTMAEGTRQEVEIYGRAVDPFTGGVFRKNKAGEIEFIDIAAGEPDPDQPKPAGQGRA